MIFHEGQIKSLSILIEALKGDGYIFVSCQTLTNTIDDTDSGHKYILLKMYKNGITTNVVIDYFGNAEYLPV
jgi:hypothetical protein